MSKSIERNSGCRECSRHIKITGEPYIKTPQCFKSNSVIPKPGFYQGRHSQGIVDPAIRIKLGLGPV